MDYCSISVSGFYAIESATEKLPIVGLVFRLAHDVVVRLGRFYRPDRGIVA